MSQVQSNPFTLVHDALVDMVANQRILSEVVRDGNRIVFNSDFNRDPMKKTVAAADLPELMLVPAGVLETNICRTSSSTSIIRQFDWVVSTGDLRANLLLLQVQWAILVCMTNWKTVLSSLEWPRGSGETFVKRANLGSAREGLSDKEFNRGVTGWSSVWSCQVEMHFKTSDLRGLLNP